MQRIVQQFDRRTTLNATGFKVYSRDISHFDAVMEKADRLLKKLRPLVKPGLCVQAGGWTGAYALPMSDYFHSVMCFEPEKSNFSILKHNTKDSNIIDCHPMALSSGVHNRHLAVARSTLAHKLTQSPGSTKCVSIDSLDLKSCEAIVLDIEGSETYAIEGAKETIKKFEPVIVIGSKVTDTRLTDVRKLLPDYVVFDTVGTKHILVHYYKAFQHGYFDHA